MFNTHTPPSTSFNTSFCFKIFAVNCFNKKKHYQFSLFVASDLVDFSNRADNLFLTTKDAMSSGPFNLGNLEFGSDLELILGTICQRLNFLRLKYLLSLGPGCSFHIPVPEKYPGCSKVFLYPAVTEIFFLIFYIVFLYFIYPSLQSHKKNSDVRSGTSCFYLLLKLETAIVDHAKMCWNINADVTSYRIPVAPLLFAFLEPWFVRGFFKFSDSTKLPAAPDSDISLTEEGVKFFSSVFPDISNFLKGSTLSETRFVSVQKLNVSNVVSSGYHEVPSFWFLNGLDCEIFWAYNPRVPVSPEKESSFAHQNHDAVLKLYIIFTSMLSALQYGQFLVFWSNTDQRIINRDLSSINNNAGSFDFSLLLFSGTSCWISFADRLFFSLVDILGNSSFIPDKECLSKFNCFCVDFAGAKETGFYFDSKEHAYEFVIRFFLTSVATLREARSIDFFDVYQSFDPIISEGRLYDVFKDFKVNESWHLLVHVREFFAKLIQVETLNDQLFFEIVVNNKEKDYRIIQPGLLYHPKRFPSEMSVLILCRQVPTKIGISQLWN